jgi:hypothetical protein
MIILFDKNIIQNRLKIVITLKLGFFMCSSLTESKD